MNIIFFGNTKFSYIGASIIHKKIGIALIVTLPDRPDKRGRLTANPMKTFAQENKIPVTTVEQLDNQTIQHIASLKPDFLIVEDYGLILPHALLTLPKYACLNIHHSLLPKHRGPSPAPFAILEGETTTGVTVIKMTNKVDAGAILAQKEYTMNPDETTESLLTTLNQLGGKIILPVIENYAQMKPQPQEPNKATYTKMMKKDDGHIDLNHPPEKKKLNRMIRAYYPWPTVWTTIKMRNQEVRIKFLPKNMLQVEGKNPVSLKDFLNGYPEMKETMGKLFDN